jgi:hypothetical protein
MIQKGHFHHVISQEEHNRSEFRREEEIQLGYLTTAANPMFLPQKGSRPEYC